MAISQANSVEDTLRYENQYVKLENYKKWAKDKPSYFMRRYLELGNNEILFIRDNKSNKLIYLLEEFATNFPFKLRKFLPVYLEMDLVFLVYSKESGQVSEYKYWNYWDAIRNFQSLDEKIQQIDDLNFLIKLPRQNLWNISINFKDIGWAKWEEDFTSIENILEGLPILYPEGYKNPLEVEIPEEYLSN